MFYSFCLFILKTLVIRVLKVRRAIKSGESNKNPPSPLIITCRLMIEMWRKQVFFRATFFESPKHVLFCVARKFSGWLVVLSKNFSPSVCLWRQNHQIFLNVNFIEIIECWIDILCAIKNYELTQESMCVFMVLYCVGQLIHFAFTNSIRICSDV